MPNSQLGINLLGSLIGAQSLEELRNPNFTITKDENGNPVLNGLPYNKPGFGTKLFHSGIAEQAGAENAQIAQAQQLANFKSGISKSVAINTILKPLQDSGYLPKDVSLDVLYASTIGGSQGDMNRQVQQLARAKTGEPTTTGTLGGKTDIQRAVTDLTKATGEAARNPTDEKALDYYAQARADAARGVVRRQPLTESTSDINALTDWWKSGSENRLEPRMDQLRESGLGIKEATVPGELAKARTGSALAQSQEEQLPTLQRTQQIGNTSALYDALHQPVPSRIYRPAGTDDWAVNSASPTMTDIAKAQIGVGANAPQSGIRLSNGLTIPHTNTSTPTNSIVQQTRQSVSKLGLTPQDSKFTNVGVPQASNITNMNSSDLIAELARRGVGVGGNVVNSGRNTISNLLNMLNVDMPNVKNTSVYDPITETYTNYNR